MATATDNCEYTPTKIRYESEAQAEAYAALYRDKYGQDVKQRAYPCPCGWWHLSSKNRNKKKNKPSSRRRKKRQLRLILDAWENEGGAINYYPTRPRRVAP